MTVLPTEGYEILDHPADMGFRAWAPTREELFVTAARTLTSILVDLDTIKPELTVDVEVEADGEEMLFFHWLSEILFLFDADGTIFSSFEILDIMTLDSGLKLKAKLSGQEFSKEEHQIKTYVKAITLHQLKVERKHDRCELQVYIDI
ncbi:MAG: archease [Candidatus Melainabacteria bacterium]|nr:archease [Candidatus Melainabacteria bacterium]